MVSVKIYHGRGVWAQMADPGQLGLWTPDCYDLVLWNLCAIHGLPYWGVRYGPVDVHPVYDVQTHFLESQAEWSRTMFAVVMDAGVPATDAEWLQSGPMACTMDSFYYPLDFAFNRERGGAHWAIVASLGADEATIVDPYYGYEGTLTRDIYELCRRREGTSKGSAIRVIASDEAMLPNMDFVMRSIVERARPRILRAGEPGGAVLEETAELLSKVRSVTESAALLDAVRTWADWHKVYRRGHAHFLRVEAENMQAARQYYYVASQWQTIFGMAHKALVANSDAVLKRLPAKCLELASDERDALAASIAAIGDMQV